MPVGGQTEVALAFTKATCSPSLPATKYATAMATSGPRRLSKRDSIITALEYRTAGRPPLLAYKSFRARHGSRRCACVAPPQQWDAAHGGDSRTSCRKIGRAHV